MYKKETKAATRVGCSVLLMLTSLGNSTELHADSTACVQDGGDARCVRGLALTCRVDSIQGNSQLAGEYGFWGYVGDFMNCAAMVEAAQAGPESFVINSREYHKTSTFSGAANTSNWSAGSTYTYPGYVQEILGLYATRLCPDGFASRGTGSSYECYKVPDEKLNKHKGMPDGNLSCGGASNAQGNPINMAVGNKYQSETDYWGAGHFPLRFIRHYNSLDGLWRHSYSAHLKIAADTITLVQADGQESYFAVQNGVIVAELTELGQLESTINGWVYHSPRNESFYFGSDGRLVRWVDPLGRTQSLSYGNGLVTVQDDFGRTLSFAEDAWHQPTEVTIGTLQVSYLYSAGGQLLEAVTEQGAESVRRQYHYEDPRDPTWLTGITDERGIRFATWAYDNFGRATISEHADGVERVTLDYNEDGSVRVTNVLGKSTVYHYGVINGVKRITAIEGQPSANCPNSNATYTYNERGQVVTRTDERGVVTRFQYNTRGLLVSQTEAEGMSEVQTTTNEWHPDMALKVQVTEPHRQSRFIYDESGRLRERIFTAAP